MSTHGMVCGLERDDDVLEISLLWGSFPWFVFCISAGNQLVPLERPRTLNWICRDEDQAGQLQKFWEQEKAIVDPRTPSSSPHLHSTPSHPRASSAVMNFILLKNTQTKDNHTEFKSNSGCEKNEHGNIYTKESNSFCVAIPSWHCCVCVSIYIRKQWWV